MSLEPRFSDDSAEDALSAESVLARSSRGGYDVRVYDSLDSTNAELKRLTAEGAPEGTVAIARTQTEGRGRMGRSFFSPAGTGLYMSLLLRPGGAAAESLSVTACAAVAAAEAIEAAVGMPAGIKWVNDVYLRGRKVCGILAEGSPDAETGRMSSIVLGVGVNLAAPEGGFPEVLRDTAGALAARSGGRISRSAVAAAFLDGFMGYYEDLGARSFYGPYVSRSMVIGKNVTVLLPGHEPVKALALGIDGDFSLRLRAEDGGILRLSSGEVSIRPDSGQGWD